MSARSSSGFVTSTLSWMGTLALLSLTAGCGAPPAKDPSGVKAAESGLKTPGKCSEAGYCWENPVPTSGMFITAWAAGPDDFYVAGLQGSVLRWNGSVWTAEGEGGEAWINALWGSGPDDVFAVGGDGLIRHRKGGKWQKEDVEDTNDFGDVWGSGPSDVFAVGENGTVFHYDGASWSGQTTRSEARLTSVSGKGPKDVYAVGAIYGESGVVLHYDGRDWEETARLGHEIYRVWVSPAGAVWAIGNDEKDKATVWKLAADGRWNPVPIPPTEYVMNISGVGEDPVILVHNDTSPSELMSRLRGEVSALEWNGKAWNRRDLVTVSSPLGKPGWGLSHDGKGNMLVAGWWGVAGTFRPGAPIPAGKQDLHLTTGNPALGRNLFSVWGTSPTDVVAVGTAGAMLHYDGQTWTPDPAGAPYDLNEIHGAKGLLVAVGGNGAMLVRRGGAWSPMQTGTPVELHGVWTDGDLIFAVGAQGTFLRCDAKTCAPVDSGTKKDLWNIVGSTASELLVDGQDSAILRWDGASVKMMASPRGLLTAIAADGQGGIMGTTYETTYRVEQGTWVRVVTGPVGESGAFWDLGPIGDGQMLGLSGGGGAPVTARRWTGTRWVEEPLPIGDSLGAGSLSGLWASEGHVFLVGYGGAILHKKPK